MNHRGPDEQDPSPSHAANANAAPSTGEIRIDVSDANEGADRVGDLPRLSRNTSRRYSSEFTNGHGPPTLYKPSADAVIAKDQKWLSDQDFDGQKESIEKQNKTPGETLKNTFKALGIVYGDIGTSPLYVFNNIFVELHTPSQMPSRDDVLGATSLVIWTIILIVLVKYALIVMLADDNGEGGTFALYSLLSRYARLNTPGRRFHETDTNLRKYNSGTSFSQRVNESMTAPQSEWKPPNRTARLLHGNRTISAILLIIVLGATAMVIGDGILTPAQSVLAAISGLGTQNAFLNIHLSKGVIVGIACAVLAFLYVFQWVGTNYLGWAFSPIVVLWLLFNLMIGIYNIAHWHPAVFAALSPHYSFKFLINNGHMGWVMLGGVLLCVTGAEAMYADLGHFTRKSVQIGLLVAVVPSLLFTYLGQAAYLIRFPAAVTNVYYNSLPHPIYWPMFVLATLASIVASQAMITAAFSIIRQSMTLGCFPRLRVVHTSDRIKGQIYIPEINYLLMFLSIAAVGGFQTLERIGSAYGVAVTFVFFITDILFCLVMLVVWETHWIYPLVFFIFFGALDGLYLSATLNKFLHGGWFPLAVALAIFLISAIWSWGQRHKQWFLQGNDKKPLYEFLQADPADDRQLQADRGLAQAHRAGLNTDSLSLRRSSITGKKERVARIEGLGLIHAETIQGVPPIFEHLLTNLPAMYNLCVFVTVREVPVPKVDADERYLITELDFPGFYRCVCRFGYMETVNLGEEFEKHMIMRMNQLTAPQAEWNVGFNDALRHKMQKHKVDTAFANKVVYIMGRVDMKSSKSLNCLQKILLEYFYIPMEKNCRALTDNWSIPRNRLIEVGMTYEVGSLDQGDPFLGLITNSREEMERPA